MTWVGKVFDPVELMRQFLVLKYILGHQNLVLHLFKITSKFFKEENELHQLCAWQPDPKAKAQQLDNLF